VQRLIKGQTDPLLAVAERVAKKYRLICFDEFHVSDIADAMILHRLLSALFDAGCTFVMTSNYHPDTLYPEGLHRDRVLPAINLIKSQLDVLNVDAGLDYRQRTLAQLQVYHTPIDDATQKKLHDAFTQLAECEDEPTLLTIGARPLQASRRAGSVVWFDFQTLCGTARSQNDYLELAAQFQTLIVSDVPKLNANLFSEARRFTWLVDVLYDHAVKLIVSAEVVPEELYVEGSFAQEFARTVSRLTEMQSQEYRNLAKRAVAHSIT
jgi:cell division protein ZapE